MESVFWKRLMETVKHLSCSLLQNELQPKTISAKTSALDVWEGPKKCQLLLWWILPQILTPSLNLKILCRIPAPSLTTHLPHPTIKLPRIQIFKTGFRKLSILSKFWELRKWQGVVMVRGSSCLRHYYALHTKIDIWLAPSYLSNLVFLAEMQSSMQSSSLVLSINPVHFEKVIHVNLLNGKNFLIFVTEIKPVYNTYFLRTLKRHSRGTHFFIFALKVLGVS